MKLNFINLMPIFIKNLSKYEVERSFSLLKMDFIKNAGNIIINVEVVKALCLKSE